VRRKMTLLRSPSMLRTLVFLLSCAITVDAAAAGMYLAPRGVRSLALGGANVASSADLEALSYNPAGLADAPNSVLVDAALPLQYTQYTRQVPGELQAAAATQGSGMGLPSPTLAVAHNFGLHPRLQFALGLAADYPAMQNFPGGNVSPLSPERYGVSDYRGTALAKVILGGAYRFTPWLALGATVQALVGNFTAVNTVSTCDGVICTQPENPAYDATVQIKSRPLAVMGGQVGLKLQLLPQWTLGLSWESGYSLDSLADLKVRLPVAPLYAQAQVSPSAPTGRIKLRLPWQGRVGVAWQRPEVASVEVAAVYEPWSVNDRIEVNLAGVTLNNLLALGTYALRSIDIEQGFKNTYSLRLGSEAWLPLPPATPAKLSVLGGLMYEPSAVPTAMLTPMAVNLDSLLVALGLQLRSNKVTVAATFAHLFLFSRTVTHSKVSQINAVGASEVTPVGNGTYQSNANIIGLSCTFSI
jgi:long-subunit fatty acid transport protein